MNRILFVVCFKCVNNVIWRMVLRISFHRTAVQSDNLGTTNCGHVISCEHLSHFIISCKSWEQNHNNNLLFFFSSHHFVFRFELIASRWYSIFMWQLRTWKKKTQSAVLTQLKLRFIAIYFDSDQSGWMFDEVFPCNYISRAMPRKTKNRPLFFSYTNIRS